MNNSTKIVWVGGALAVVIIGGFLLWQQRQSQEPETIRLGLGVSPGMVLAKIAVDKNFFAEEGLNVEVKEFTGGKFALQALLGGSLDMSASAEFPVTLATVNAEKLSILAEINKTKSFSMLLYKEGEIFDPATYFARKRKIATSVGASVEFFVHEFATKYKISSSQYEVISSKPEDIPIVLANHNVDGAAIYEPYSYFAEQRTETDNLFKITEPELYAETIVIGAKPEWVATHQGSITKFLRGLKKAEEFTKNNPEEAMNILASFTKLDIDTVRKIWDNYILEVKLGKELVQTMQRQAEWAKNTGKVDTGTTIPNFRELIVDAPLKEVAPSRVEL